jgi:arsenate reductase
MKKIYHLQNCSTCKRILSELKIGKDVVLQDIKEEKISPEQLTEMAKLAGSYEKLFSRVAMKYRILGLDKMELKESDYKKYILEEYTFLKRPTIISGDKIFIGSTKSTIEALKKEFK